MIVEIATIRIQVELENKWGIDAQCTGAVLEQYLTDGDQKADFLVCIEPVLISGKAFRTLGPDTWIESERAIYHINEKTTAELDLKNRILKICPKQGLNIDTVQLYGDLKFLLAYALLEKGGALLHSASAAKDGTAYLFFGQSGAGKSTVAKKLYHEFQILNDDLNAVLPTADGFQVFSTPFVSEGEFYHTKSSASLKSIYCLKKSTKCILEPMTYIDKYSAVLKSVYATATTDYLGEWILRNSEDICQSIEIQRLAFSLRQAINLALGNSKS